MLRTTLALVVLATLAPNVAQAGSRVHVRTSIVPSSTPTTDARGQRIDTRSQAVQGLAPETRAALDNPHMRYRGELCQGLPTHAEQRACLNYRP